MKQQIITLKVVESHWISGINTIYNWWGGAGGAGHKTFLLAIDMKSKQTLTKLKEPFWLNALFYWLQKRYESRKYKLSC